MPPPVSPLAFVQNNNDKLFIARWLLPAAVCLVLLQPGCMNVEKRDPLGISLQRHLNQPVMTMVRRFGTPMQESSHVNERRYVWDRPACTISARVDGQELVIDAYWKGDRDTCAKLLDDTAVL